MGTNVVRWLNESRAEEAEVAVPAGVPAGTASGSVLGQRGQQW
jgi:hypothetical protein